MKHRYIPLLFVLLAALLVVGGCAGQQTPAQRLYLLNQTVTTALNATADARDAGLVTQAELESARPFVKAFQSASRKAGEQIRTAEARKAAGLPPNDSPLQDALNQVAAAFEQIRPLVEKIQKVKDP